MGCTGKLVNIRALTEDIVVTMLVVVLFNVANDFTQ